MLIDPDTQQEITDPNLLNQIEFRPWPGKPFYVQLEVDESTNSSVQLVKDINIFIDTQE
jgi:hypothetical protein